jgi:hypothetical protein
LVFVVKERELTTEITEGTKKGRRSPVGGALCREQTPHGMPGYLFFFLYMGKWLRISEHG